MLFKGSGVALVTPFNEDLSINYDELKKLICFHLQNNTDALIICGTTGEGSTLTDNEFSELIKFVVKEVNKKIPVIVGSGSNNTKKAIEKSKIAESFGADGLLVVTPYYNKCTQEGLYLHYEAISNEVSIPIILYNVPTRTCVNIEPETVLKLSNLKNICGIKEASPDLTRISKLISILPSNFYVYSGNDDLTLPILSLGGQGVISVFANIYPKVMHDICYSFFNNDIANSKKLHYNYLEIMNNLFIEVNPIPIKEAMNILGYNVGTCRLPLCKMKDENIKMLKKGLDL